MGLVLRYIFLSGIVIALQSVSIPLKAQDRCGTVAYYRSTHTEPNLHKLRFEQWLDERMFRQQTSRSERRAAGPYQVPVVVHVIHNGEDIGTGANISDAQILSQIRVLNEDYNRQNTDAVNTPPEFLGVAGSMDIEFVLAKQDEDGLATNGIVRVNGGESSWSMNDNYALKDLSYWPAEQYFNIWVCNLTDSFVGYAQFPESDLEGLENSSTNRLTDGVVIWYRAFGSVDDGISNLDPSFNKGRTLTHETGHFFGLRHIWGDNNNCSDTDYVNDTPNQAGSSSGCPTHPKTDSCSEVVMFQNFLDYTDDDCMNLFTQGQITRMITVIENSPRRNSLLTSHGLQEPDPLPNDLGIRSIIFPDASVCTNEITPVIEIRNYGNNQITSARIRLTVDGAPQETKDFVLTLNPMESVQVSFAPLSLASGEHGIAFEIRETNAGTDGGNYNDFISSPVIVPAFIDAPFAWNFNSQPPGWITQNPDGQITWQIVTAPNENPSNNALKLNFYDYEDKIGEIDTYLSPVIDLSSAPAATLTFDVAHARFQSSNDRLMVVALTNCENVLTGTVLYDKAGFSLATAPSTTTAFTPSGPNQWRKELINLTAFVGKEKVQLAFIGTNDWGNNLYLDNITFYTEQTVDVSLTRLATPSVVTCEDNMAPKIIVQNAGSVTLTGFDLEYAINASAPQTVVINDLDLSYGETKEIELPVITFSEGINILSVNLKNPNGSTDDNPDNNQNEFTIVINQAEDRIPLRQNFDGEFTSAWTIINPEGRMNWETISTNFNQSLYFNGYNNGVIGDEAWLVSPVLDFSRTSQASLLFDLSYAYGNAGEENLIIMASTDCGNTFNEIDYNYPNIVTAKEDWLPQSPEDWKRNIQVDLSALAGEENVRIAFVIRNENGNNFYLDNIEFFTTADPDPIEIEELYSIYGYDLTNPEQSELKITFNLPERQNVRYTVINTIGKIETDGLLRDVLNQTFPLNLSQRLAPGMYFVRVQIGGEYYSSKVLVIN